MGQYAFAVLLGNFEAILKMQYRAAPPTCSFDTFLAPSDGSMQLY